MVVLKEVFGESSSSNTTYDVFLSFRGVDTRLNFIDHLYNALLEANLRTFLDDDEMETGDHLGFELKRAIKSSRASIIVLSENYASSTWCLDELVLILEQRLNSNQLVIPIFYHVEPTHVRKQEGSFKDAMAMHRHRMEAEANPEKRCQWAQKIDRWSTTLTEVAQLKGMDAKGRKETEFIRDIITSIHRSLCGHLQSVLPLLFGMEDSIDFITSWLEDGSSYQADILTILGMGGIGKTSLARYVHGSHYRLFAKSSFIECIGEKCAAQVSGLLDLQKQLFDDISKTSQIKPRDSLAYTSMIENGLTRKKVFIVLDNIDSVDQLHSLLGKKGFYPGSKIIITTKDASLTEKYAPINPSVKPKHTKLLLEGLQNKSALQLLSHHAFMSNGPKDGYEVVSKQVIAYCKGHPLALKVLGESLCNKTIAEWEDCVIGLKEETDSRIMTVLKMSFDAIQSNNDKELFKYIACFFIQKDRVFAETILNSCGIRTTGIRNLVDKCLLTIGPDGILMMHQLIQEMGRDLVRQESPYRPEERSRLWCHKESFNVLEENKGTKYIKGLVLDMSILEMEMLCGSVKLQTSALSKMPNIMILHINFVQLSGSYKNFPPKLRWLCMHGFSLKSMPLDLPMENLVVLDMSYSNIESFDMTCSNPLPPANRQKVIGSRSKDKRLLGSLKSLTLSFSPQLRRIGGFSELPALQRLIVIKCGGLIDICETIDQCVELVYIDLSYCKKLKKVPKTIGRLQKVETLLLDGCDLLELPIKKKDMDSLEVFDSKIVGIYSHINSYASMEAIPSEWKFFEVYLPSSLGRLSLANNNLSTESFPMDFSCLYTLKDLCLDGNPIVSLPNCVRTLPRLETLGMSNCLKLMSVEHPPSTLKQLNLYNNCWKPNYKSLLRKIAFDPKMAPLELIADMNLLAPSSFEIEGMVKIQPMASVKIEVLRSLDWRTFWPTEERCMVTTYNHGRPEESHIQMYYEFGIFSTICKYNGRMPRWNISNISITGSVTFTIPCTIRGLNFFYVGELFELPMIRITNNTKKHTWIYKHCIKSISICGGELLFLSHWMFGPNEMDVGDEITINLENYGKYCKSRSGVCLVYDVGSMDVSIAAENGVKEDPLAYYKTWNHIIGGDLSAFRLTSGEYFLYTVDFFRSSLFNAHYKERKVLFNALSTRKCNIPVHAQEMYHNLFCSLELPVEPEHRDFISLFKGLRECPLASAIKANPAIHTSWIYEFWKNAKGVEETKGRRYIQCEVAKSKFTVDEDDIRRVLDIHDSPTDSVIKFRKDRDLEPFLEKMGYEGKLSSFEKKYLPPYWKALFHIIAHCLSDQKGGFDSLRVDWLRAVKALTDRSEFNFSRMFFNILFTHTGVKVDDRWSLYPRFIQMVLDDKIPEVPRPVYEVEKGADGVDLPSKEPYHVGEIRENAISLLLHPKGKSYRYSFKKKWSKFGRFEETEQGITEPVVSGSEVDKGKRKAVGSPKQKSKRPKITIISSSQKGTAISQTPQTALALTTTETTTPHPLPPSTDTTIITTSPIHTTFTSSPPISPIRIPSPIPISSQTTSPHTASPSTFQRILAELQAKQINIPALSSTTQPIVTKPPFILPDLPFTTPETSPTRLDTPTPQPIIMSLGSVTQTDTISQPLTSTLPETSLNISTPITSTIPLTLPIIIPTTALTIFSPRPTTSPTLTSINPKPVSVGKPVSSPRFTDPVLLRLTALEESNKKRAARDIQVMEIIKKQKEELAVLRKEKDRADNLEGSLQVLLNERARDRERITSLESTVSDLKRQLIEQQKENGDRLKDISEITGQLSHAYSDYTALNELVGELKKKVDRLVVSDGVTRAQYAIMIKRMDDYRDAACIFSCEVAKLHYLVHKLDATTDISNLVKEINESISKLNDSNAKNEDNWKKAAAYIDSQFENSRKFESRVADVLNVFKSWDNSADKASEDLSIVVGESSKSLPLVLATVQAPLVTDPTTQEFDQREPESESTSDSEEYTDSESDDESDDDKDEENDESDDDSDGDGGDDREEGDKDGDGENGSGNQDGNQDTENAGLDDSTIHEADTHVQQIEQADEALDSLMKDIMCDSELLITEPEAVSGVPSSVVVSEAETSISVMPKRKWHVIHKTASFREKLDRLHDNSTIYFRKYYKQHGAWAIRRKNGDLAYFYLHQLRTLPPIDLHAFERLEVNTDSGLADHVDLVIRQESRADNLLKSFRTRKVRWVDNPSKIDSVTGLPRKEKYYLAPKEEPIIFHGEPFEPDSLKDFLFWSLDITTGEAVIYCRNSINNRRFFDEHELLRLSEVDIRRLLASPMKNIVSRVDYSKIVEAFNKFVIRIVENKAWSDNEEVHFEYETD